MTRPYTLKAEQDSEGNWVVTYYSGRKFLGAAYSRRNLQRALESASSAVAEHHSEWLRVETVRKEASEALKEALS